MSSSSAKRKKGVLDCSFNYLDDTLLIEEILCRLPASLKFIARCKSVSKRWYSLISNPDFLRCFLARNIRKITKAPENYALCESQKQRVISIYSLKLTYQHTLFIEDSKFNHCKILKSIKRSLVFLSEDFKYSRIVASCNDLLLVQAEPSKAINSKCYYIYNPFTTQWISLPLPSETNPTHFGLIFEPFFFLGKYHQFFINPGFKSRVAFFTQKEDSIFVEIYSVESEKWESIVLPFDLFEICSNVVAFKGKLHWYNGSHIIVYDPFNIVGKQSFIYGFEFDFVSEEKLRTTHYSYYIGVFNGHLRVMELQSDGVENCLMIWELFNYKRGKWRLERSFEFTTWRLEQSLYCGIQRFTESSAECSLPLTIDRSEEKKKTRRRCKALAIDPTDENIVYLQFDNRVVKCDLEKEKFKESLNFGDGFKLDDHRYFFQVLAPSWPTPLYNKYSVQ